MKNKENISVDSTNILVLQGDDRLAIDRFLSSVIQPEKNAFAQLNTSHLDGNQAEYSHVAAQLNMLPFGQGKRIVILDNALDFLAKKGGQDWLTRLISQYPPTSFFVMIIYYENNPKDKNKQLEKLKKIKKIKNSITDESVNHSWKEFLLPKEKDMPNWIMNEAERRGGKFQPAAAYTLATLIGNNLFQATQEIEKAIAYAGSERQITVEDIRLLCAKSKEEKIFSLVDAIGLKDGKKAIGLLKEISEDLPLQYIFTMIVRQMRMLLQTKIILDARGGRKNIIESCNLRFDWQADNLIKQAKRFSLGELQGIYKQLDQIDELSKIGQISLDSALDRLIASVAA